MQLPDLEWPYLPTIIRLALALGIGLFVGFERERRGKEFGLRTFGFAALLGCIGGLVGEAYALLSIILLGVLVAFSNIHKITNKRGPELTTSAALLVVGFAGVLCGQGHTLTPGAIGVATAALLAWKEPLSGFSERLSEVELRSAILFGILAIVIYPALPEGPVDPWGVLDLRAAWITIILIAGIGFANYILWKVYGSRGVELTGFLGGLVNSSVAISELAIRVKETQGQMADIAYRAMLLAMVAMIVRNTVLLAILSPAAVLQAAIPLALMLVSGVALALIHWRRTAAADPEEAPSMRLESPFSLLTVLRFGLVLLAIQLTSTLAQRFLGQIGVYVISFVGGLFSSASAVAAAANLSAAGALTPAVAGVCAVIASFASVLVNLALVLPSQERVLIRRMIAAVGLVAVMGAVGVAIQVAVVPGILPP